jgi:hypothetical protein
MLIPFPWSSPAPRSDLSTLNGYRQTWPFRAATDRMASGVAMSGWSLVGIRDARGALIRNHDIQFAPPALRQKMLDALPPEQIQAVSTHPLLSMLRSGNPWIVGISLMEMTQIYIDLTGKAFWLLERKQVGNLSIPYRAWPLPPHWIQQLPTPGTPYYEVHFPNSLQRIAETDVLRFHRPDVLNPYMQGNGLGSSLGDVDNFMRFASEFLSSHFYNRAIPPFIGMIQGIGEEGLKKLQARFFEEQQGQFKGGKPFFINREMKVSELSQRFDSMQLVELLHYGRDSFQQTYAIPPELLGILTNANRCLDDKTECLTKRGWLHHLDLTEQDEIATIHPDTEKLEYHRPTAILRYPYEGPLHYWKTRRIDFACTPNHRLRYRASQSAKYWRTEQSDVVAQGRTAIRWRVTSAGYTGSETVVRIPQSAYVGPGMRGHDPGVDGYAIPVNDFAPFLGYWLAEGSLSPAHLKRYDVSLSQRPDGPHALAMQEAFNAIGMGEVRVYTQENRIVNGPSWPMNTYHVSSKSLCEWLRDETGGLQHERRIPSCVFDWPMEAQQALLFAYRDGDGTVFNVRGSFTTVTCSQALADDMQRLALHIGWRATIKMDRPAGLREIHGRESECRAYWRVTFSHREQAGLTPQRDLSIGHYSGTVWCVDVPNHLFITRRNGKVAVHGNSTVAVANYVHSRWNLVPRLEFIRATFQERLVPLYDPRLIITYASPVEEDSDFYKSVMDMHEWAFSEDELRAMAGKGPEAGGAGKVHRFPAKSWFGTIPMAAAQGPASAGLSAKAQKIRAQQSPTRRTGTDD